MEGRRRGPGVAGPRWFIDGWEDSPFDPEPESEEGVGSGISKPGDLGDYIGGGSSNIEGTTI